MTPGELEDGIDTMSTRSLGARLRDLRARAGLSQSELATAAGVSGSYISLIEMDRRVPREGTLERLSRALHLSMADVLGTPPGGPGQSSKGNWPWRSLTSRRASRRLPCAS